MDYQALYDALTHRNQRNDEIDNELIAAGRNLRQPSDEELQEERRQHYQQCLDRLEQLTDPTEIAHEAILLIISATEVGPEHLQQALSRIEQEEIQRDKAVEAAVALLEYEAKFPTSIDIRREQKIVWQALTA